MSDWIAKKTRVHPRGSSALGCHTTCLGAQIERSIYLHLDPTGADVSLRTYIYTTLYGRADLEGVLRAAEM